MEETFGALLDYYRGQSLCIYEGDVTVELLDSLVEANIRFNIVAVPELADVRFEKR